MNFFDTRERNARSGARRVWTGASWTITGLAIFAVAGCAAAPQSKSDAMMPSAEAEEANEAAADPRGEVERLLQTIEASRPGGAEGGARGGVVEEGPTGGDAGRPVESGDACAKLCESSDAICVSATRICTIAEAHGEDVWFADKCQWGKRECNNAGAECVKCEG